MKKYFRKYAYAEGKILEMEAIIKSRKFDEKYIRGLIGKQKGELTIKSKYYYGNIAEGNWSLIEDDEKIKKLDTDVDLFDMIHELDEYKFSERKKDAEYEYVFIPSYYAVKMLILYYLDNPKEAKRIYGLKNAVVTRKGRKFYGGLPFILRYIGGEYEDERIDLGRIINEVLDKTYNINNTDNFMDDFIQDIIDCLNDFYQKDLVLDRRIHEYNNGKDNSFIIDFYQEMKDQKLNYMMVNDYKIFMHRDIDKDWKHLRKNEILKAKERISKTPKHPNNDSPKDSEALTGDLKGWFSQRITQKDRLVYRIEKDEKRVYIATVCGHYINAPKRVKSTSSYR